MDVVLVVLAIGLIGVVAAVAFGRIRGGLDDPPVARPDIELPPGRLGAVDLAGLRFSVALRGYRMDEVDAVLDRLRAELRTRDAELAELRPRHSTRDDLWGFDRLPDDRLPDDRLPDDRLPDDRLPDRLPDDRLPDRLPDERVPDRLPDDRVPDRPTDDQWPDDRAADDHHDDRPADIRHMPGAGGQ